ncbi:MAG TPA: SET domain-containing protein [Kofleriaceae bacterium]|nr:SET domain-containing protein [Kofleriaceae bacterium]
MARIAPPDPDAHPRAAAVDRMLAWARERGARFDQLDLRVAADGSCAAYARDRIAAGERIVTIPRRLMILHDELAASATGVVEPYGPRLQIASDRLVVWLVLEARRADSPWRPYLDALPPTPDLPCVRDDLDLGELAGTLAASTLAGERAHVTSFHALLAPAVRAQIALADFARGRALVRSRGYKVTIGGAVQAALIPVVDLLDHRPGDTRWGFEPDEDAYAITALRELAAGEPVHAWYGPHGNASLLAGYGFALADNPDDEAGLILGGETFPVGTRADDRFWRALAAARGGRRSFEAAAEPDALAALADAARAGRARLGAHPSDDDGWLADPARTPWQRACGWVRRGERAILDHVVAFAAAADRDVAGATPARLRAAAGAIAAGAIGADRLRREYLRAAADALDADDGGS